MRIRHKAGLANIVFLLISRLPAKDLAKERKDWQDQMQQAVDLESKGALAEAERKLIGSVHAAEQANSDPLWLPMVLDRLGGLNRRVGRPRQAEQYYLRAADLWERRFGSTSLGLAMTLSDLAWVYVGLKDLQRAGSLWQRSLEIRTAVLGPDHPAVARVYGYRAVGAFAARHLDEAQSFCQQALRIYERAGNVPGETDQVWSSLASVRLRQGRAQEAIQLTKKAIALGQKAERPSIRLLGGYFYNLALAESAAAQTADAESDFQHALALLKGARTPSQILRRNILHSYADFLLHTGRKKEARTIEQQAMNLEKIISRETYTDDLVDISSFLLR